jgi:basic membrane protein A
MVRGVTPSRVIIALAVANAVLLAVGAIVVPAPEWSGKKALRVGVVFDVGGKNDKSFNESAWRGLQRAEVQLGIEVDMREPSEGADRATALRALAAEGNDVVIGVGFLFGPDLEKLAKRFEKVKFVGIDYTASDGVGTIDNLVGLRFREHEGSFVVGAIAGLLTKSKTVGFVGGMKIPLIRKFEAGYYAGVKHVCPDCTIAANYAGTEPKAFADPTLGDQLATAQYGAGADIIFHAAGKTGDGVFAAAKRRDGLAIGVDSDQFRSAPCCVVTSMIKHVDVAIVDLLRDVIAGRFTPGAHEFGLAEGGVAFVADEHNRTLLPMAVLQRARAIAAEIVAGKIAVPDR